MHKEKRQDDGSVGIHAHEPHEVVRREKFPKNDTCAMLSRKAAHFIIRSSRSIQTVRIFSTSSQAEAAVAIPISLGVEYQFFKHDDVDQLSKLLRTNLPSEPAELALDRAAELGFDSAGALYLVHCLSKLPVANRNRSLLASVIKRIEEEYFAADSGWLNPSSPYAHLLRSSGLIGDSTSASFKEIIHGLPNACKLVILSYSPQSHRKSRRAPMTPAQIEAAWHKRDPVDMEDVEREHYLKTGQVLRTKRIEAKPSPMPIGSRLKQVLGLDFLERLSEMPLSDLVSYLSVISTSPQNSIFHRDLKHDSQFAICKRLLSFSQEEIGQHILPITLAVCSFEPTLEMPSRVLNRRIIPSIRNRRYSVQTTADSLLNEVSKEALLAATIIGSGRVRVSNLLLSYLMPALVRRSDDISSEIVVKLLDSMVLGGCVHVELVESLSSRLSSSTTFLATLVHARNHFGLFGNSYDALVQRLIQGLSESSPDSISSLSPSDLARILNCVYSVPSIEDSPIVLEMTKKLLSAYPDMDIDQLGRIDSILE